MVPYSVMVMIMNDMVMVMYEATKRSTEPMNGSIR